MMKTLVDAFVMLLIGSLSAQFAVYTVLKTARAIRGYVRNYRLDRDIGGWDDVDATPSGTPTSREDSPF